VLTINMWKFNILKNNHFQMDLVTSIMRKVDLNLFSNFYLDYL
jgi:hypothetical protein